MSDSSLDSVSSPSRREMLRRSQLASLAAAGGALAPAARALASSTPHAAMRSPSKKRGSEIGPKTVPAPPPAAVVALTRMAFGPRPGDVAAFNALGGNDAQRLTAYVDQQLDPTAINDGAAQARLAQSGFTTLGKSLGQLWQDHVVPDPPWEIRMQPYFETELATFVRAIHSRRQLLEVLADFWHNHFNVYAYDFAIGPTWVYTDRDVIRANALGNFRQMFEAVAKSPGMLYYLNNNVNSVDGPNENYGRELLELHGLGAENFLGSIPQAAVPRDGQGRPIGYVDEDVTAAARCLTGWTLSDRWWDPDFGNTGQFLYYAPWHDNGPKTILGSSLPANQPAMKDGRDLFDLIAQHPGTGRFLARKLCRRLLGDFPPQSVVDAAAAVFTAQHAAPDQIKQVVRTILLSPEFLTTWGDKIKRPFEVAVSMFRGAQGDLPFRIDESATSWFMWMYYQTGQSLFSWHPPNGYPDFKAAWKATSPRVMCWRLANMLIQVDDGEGHYFFDVLGQTPAGVRSAREIATFWADRILGRSLPTEEEDEIIAFMAAGYNPDLDLPLATDEDTQDRLRAMVALLFMSPSFLWR